MAFIGVWVVFCQGGGGVNHFPQNSRKLPKFLRDSQKEMMAIRCNNIGSAGMLRWLDTVLQG